MSFTLHNHVSDHRFTFSITDNRPTVQFELYWCRAGIPPLLQVAVLAQEVDFYAPGLPIGMQDVLIAGLPGGLGHLLGYRAHYDRFDVV